LPGISHAVVGRLTNNQIPPLSGISFSLDIFPGAKVAFLLAIHRFLVEH